MWNQIISIQGDIKSNQINQREVKLNQGQIKGKLNLRKITQNRTPDCHKAENTRVHVKCNLYLSVSVSVFVWYSRSIWSLSWWSIWARVELQVDSVLSKWFCFRTFSSAKRPSSSLDYQIQIDNYFWRFFNSYQKSQYLEFENSNS